MNKPSKLIINFDTPILLIFFNRQKQLEQVITSIKKVKPNKLYISCDGARINFNNENEKVKKIRDWIISSIDWKCEIYTRFIEENLGCGQNVKESIDWFFETEEYGIILEDDCVPEIDFYYFAQSMLYKYKNDNRIGMVSGVNHFTKYYNSPYSYLFSKYKSCWGWATWKRAWKNMDYEMDWLQTDKADCIINNMGYSCISKIHWKNALNKIIKGHVNTWDWQWYFSLSAKNQLGIFPNNNLVSNIGFDSNATHTFGKAKEAFLITKSLKQPLTHPKDIISDKKFDKIFEQKKIRLQILKDLIPHIIKQKIKKCFH